VPRAWAAVARRCVVHGLRSSPAAPACPPQTPLQVLTEHSDLHVRELAFAARQYAIATASTPGDHDALYHHGLVLQELSAKVPPGSEDQIAFLKQVRTL